MNKETKDIKKEKTILCPECDGSGVNFDNTGNCLECDGSGYLLAKEVNQ